MLSCIQQADKCMQACTNRLTLKPLQPLMVKCSEADLDGFKALRSCPHGGSPLTHFNLHCQPLPPSGLSSTGSKNCHQSAFAFFFCFSADLCSASAAIFPSVLPPAAAVRVLPPAAAVRVLPPAAAVLVLPPAAASELSAAPAAAPACAPEPAPP